MTQIKLTRAHEQMPQMQMKNMKIDLAIVGVNVNISWILESKHILDDLEIVSLSDMYIPDLDMELYDRNYVKSTVHCRLI